MTQPVLSEADRQVPPRHSGTQTPIHYSRLNYRLFLLGTQVRGLNIVAYGRRPLGRVDGQNMGGNRVLAAGRPAADHDISYEFDSQHKTPPLFGVSSSGWGWYRLRNRCAILLNAGSGARGRSIPIPIATPKDKSMRRGQNNGPGSGQEDRTSNSERSTFNVENLRPTLQELIEEPASCNSALQFQALAVVSSGGASYASQVPEAFSDRLRVRTPLRAGATPPPADTVERPAISSGERSACNSTPVLTRSGHERSFACKS